MNEDFMKLALLEARKAFKKGEVPIGAVVVKEGKVLAKAHNTRQRSKNAVNHAEIIAISKACKKNRDWRLENTEIYVTLEPCPMCAGAIANARIETCCYGAADKTSTTNLAQQIFQDVRLNHKVNSIGGILEPECAALLRDFFASRRKG